MGKLILFTFLIFTTLLTCSKGHYEKWKGAGPSVKQSWGEPWPKPQRSIKYGENFMIVRPYMFNFEVTNHTCEMIEQALKRYYAIIMQSQATLFNPPSDNQKSASIWKDDEAYRGYLDILEVNLLSNCEYMPNEDMDESYKIKLDTPSNPKKGILVAKTNWGILRGLETFSQLVHHTPDHSALRVKSSRIDDFPRFSFRSVLVDTSRHFIPVKALLQNLDIMAMNKMNIFHWHIVDDPSFPYQSILFPELSNKGSFHPFTHVYTQQDIATIVEYARVRGIRVIPEFDTPGHTQSWGAAIPNLLTKCYSHSNEVNSPTPDGRFGPIDPTYKENYNFLRNFFSEVASVFPDKYLHLGGDEVDFACWESNPAIQKFMENQNWTDYGQLEGFFMQNVMKMIHKLPQNKSVIVWQEVVNNGVQVQQDTMINVWKGGDYQDELVNVTSRGYRVLLYSCWYLDQISWGIDWPRYYKCEPQNFTGSVDLVVGGGAAMWSEFVDVTNFIGRLWPRASAPAERLWSAKEVNDVNEAEPRISEHRCRLLSRGFRVEPINGPGFCFVNLDKINFDI